LSEKKGSRDISDLKARLGLKKQGAQTGSTPRAGGNGSGGVAAPPGMNLPPPPGMAPPQPQAPPPPDASSDPFGAMNHMVKQHIPQRAPEIVIVNDGRPVEHVGQQSNFASIAKLAAPAAVALIVGIAIGKIGTGASFYNDGIKGAKAILGDKNTQSTVASLKKALSDLDTALDEAKTKHNFKPDVNVDKQLKEIAARLDVKPEMLRVLHQAEHQLVDHEVVGQLLAFYQGVGEVKDLIDQHNKSALGDDMLLKQGKAKADANTIQDGILAGQVKYGVYLQAPTDSDRIEFGAKLVELDGVYCGTSNTPAPKCPEGESPTAFAYRNDPNGVPIKGDLASSGSDSIPSKKLVLLLQNGMRDSIIKGSEPSVSEIAYTRRLKGLFDLVHGKSGPDGKPQGGLLDDGNKLETKLQTEAAKGTTFTFFM